ncbi:MAG: formate dehydrogenase accessory sulfurtransferase FdhD [Acidobacteriota bacterium]
MDGSARPGSLSGPGEEKMVSDDSPRPGAQGISSLSGFVFDRSGKGIEKPLDVIGERPVTLYLNGREMVTLLCAGRYLEELAVGFFHADGFLERLEDLESVKVDEEAGKVEVKARGDSSLLEKAWMKRTVTSGCGKGSLFYYSLDALLSRPVESSLRITPNQILDRMEDLNHLSETYRLTHGVHNTILATPEKTLIFRDDIGRHNAVDMIVGHVFLNSIPLDDKLLVTTGRLTSEIVIKLAKVNLPILVSRNTGTTLSIELARSLGITLIGFARAGKFTAYSGWERIVEG